MPKQGHEKLEDTEGDVDPRWYPLFADVAWTTEHQWRRLFGNPHRQLDFVPR